MRYPVIAVVVLLSVSSLSWAADSGQSKLQTENEKASYSIGYQVGVSINRDAVEVDLDKLIQGLQDGVAKKDPLLSSDEMRQQIVSYKEKARDLVLRKIQEVRVKNAEESKNFLAENAKKEGVKTTESGLQYRIIKEGEGESPKLTDFVSVHYRGTFPDGTEFDNSYSKGKPQRIQTDGVIKGWTEALQMMKVGSQWEIFLPPELAYGRSGLTPTIPPNKVLVFQMELLAIEKDKKSTNELEQ